MKKTAKKFILRLAASICALVVFVFNSFSVFAMNFDFDDISKSVFVVASMDRFEYSTSIGTGFAISEHYVLTNAHVILDENKVAIASYSKTAENNIGNDYEAQLVSMDKEMDIAVLYISDTTLIPAQLADADTIKEGDDVYAIGTPAGLPYTLTKGTVSSKLRVMDGMKYVQTDAAINSGNSGGPLLNDDGEVIGMNTLKLTSNENIGFAIRVDSLNDYLIQHNIFTNRSPEESDSEIASSENSDSSIITSSESEEFFEEKVEDDNDYDYEDDEDDGVYLGVVAALGAVIAILVGVAIAVIGVTTQKKKEDDLQIPVARQNFASVNKSQEETTLLEQKPNDNTYALKGGILVLSGAESNKQIDIIDGKNYILGKDSKLANIVFDSSYSMVSRVHCSVTFDSKSNRYYVVDNSSNGMFFENGQRLAKGTRTAVNKGTVMKLADDNCKIKFL